MASQNLPDIVSYDYQSGADAAFAEEIYRPLDDLMEYCPNLQALIDSNDDIRKQMTTNAAISGAGASTTSLRIRAMRASIPWLPGLGLPCVPTGWKS